MVENSLVSSEIDLLTDLEASAARVSVGKKTFTFCSLYLYPSTNYSKAIIEHLFDQLPRPAVIMGDFNAHNPLWGSSSSNRRGRDLEDIFTLRNMIVLNDGTHTYLHRTNNTESYLDLTVVDPSVVLDFNWSVLEDTHGSDHYPILLEAPLMDDEDTSERFNFKKADWDSYSENCRGRIKEESIFDKVLVLLSLLLVFFLISQMIVFLNPELQVGELRFLGLMISEGLQNEGGNVHFADLDVHLLLQTCWLSATLELGASLL